MFRHGCSADVMFCLDVFPKSFWDALPCARRSARQILGLILQSMRWFLVNCEITPSAVNLLSYDKTVIRTTISTFKDSCG